jgi:Glycosyl transferase family 2
MTHPIVSVIVPSYNYGHLLTSCVESILSQEGVGVRVLVIDDCSPDDTHVVGRALSERDPRVEFRRHDVNQGLIATANEGLEWADGDHVVLLSADDLLLPGALQRAARTMELHPDVGMVYGPTLFAHPDRPLPTATGRSRGTSVWAGADWIRMRCRTGYNCISSPEVVVRNSVQRAVGGYDARCSHASDLNMWLRIAAVADVAYLRGTPQAIYRIHPGGMLRSNQAGPMDDLRERRNAFDSFFESSGPSLEDAEGLGALAGRALARQALWRASRTVDRGLSDGRDALAPGDGMAFALEVCPDARRLREWRGLHVRRRLGVGRSGWFPPFVVTGAAHRLRSHAERLRRARRGV